LILPSARSLDIWMYNFTVEDTPEDDAYVFGGFQQPINADGSSILFKLGSTIPVKITLSDSQGQSVQRQQRQYRLLFLMPYLERKWKCWWKTQGGPIPVTSEV